MFQFNSKGSKHRIRFALGSFRVEMNFGGPIPRNSVGVNVKVDLQNHTRESFPKDGVTCAALQTLQSFFHGDMLSASAMYEAECLLPGVEKPKTIYANHPGGVACDVILLGVFVGGFNAQPLPPASGIHDGGVSLAAFPPNGAGNGIDMLPGVPGQTIKCPLLIAPSVFSLFDEHMNKAPERSVLRLKSASVFLTFFGETWEPALDLHKKIKKWSSR